MARTAPVVKNLSEFEGVQGKKMEMMSWTLGALVFYFVSQII